ncbi:hypothetical protein [Kiloniella sp. b19]|uniref:hypothetical protein n=1 Tax=Kiloniella sp. GXU_MW_B19 TaxID=3141326 RepID=UPI0031D13D66
MSASTVTVPLDEFRTRLGAWLKDRHVGPRLDDEAHGLAMDSLVWLESHHRNALDYVLRNDQAFQVPARKSETGEEIEPEVTVSMERDQVLFLEAAGLPLVCAASQAVAGAVKKAREHGLGLCIIKDVRDVIALAPILERVAQSGMAAFGSWTVEPATREAVVLDGVSSSARSLAFIPREDDTILHMECMGLVQAHMRQMRGVVPQKLGDLIAQSLLPTDVSVPGVAILCADLPDAFENMAKAMEVAAREAPARLFHDWEKSKRNADVAEKGFELEELSWMLVASSRLEIPAGNVDIPETEEEKL